MSSMREKLARAACRVQCQLTDKPDLHCYDRCKAHPDSAKLAEHYRQVDAVLSWLPLTPKQLEGLASGDMVVVAREPSDGALSAGAEVTFEDDVRLRAMWQAMIGAAQKPAESETAPNGPDHQKTP